MIKEFKSNSGHSYTIDTERVTCTCPHFMYRSGKHAIGTRERLCKHLQAALEEDPKSFPKEYGKPVEIASEVAVVMDDKVRYPRSFFDSYAKSLRMLAQVCEVVDKYEICGSYRRMATLVSDLDLMVTLSDPTDPESINEMYNKVLLAFPNHQILAKGNKKMMVMIDGIIHLDVKVVPSESWGCALMHFTGPKTENIRLRAKASRKGWKLNEYGLIDEASGKNLAENMTEKEVYQLLGETYKAPWER